MNKKNDPVLDLQDIYGATPLIRAVMVNNINLTRELLACGANPDIANKHGYSALHYAAVVNYDKIIEILLEAGANPYIRCNAEKSPIDEALDRALERYANRSISPKPSQQE